MRVALAQLNCFVGDCAGNAEKVIGSFARARWSGAQLLVLPELAIPGYPPEDLLHRKDFVEANLSAFRRVVRASRESPAVTGLVGFVDRRAGRLHNALGVVRAGRILATYHKRVLPNYGVFDEQRYFTPGGRPCVVRVGEFRVALTVCEDLWLPRGPAAEALKRSKADLIVNASASPYESGKIRRRERLFGGYARRCRAPLVYLNLVGGQDELVFDGQSLLFDSTGRTRARMAPFEEEWTTVDLALGRGGRPGWTTTATQPAFRRRPLPPLEEIRRALVLGIRDYAVKNGFRGAVIALSGGIDSALTACLAAEALGPEAVTGVSMPSRYTSRMSREDAKLLSRNLGIGFLEFSVEPVYSAYLNSLGRHVSGPEGDLARQNLQARIRGANVMALSNRYGWLLLATGNKSEMSVGYATLYGDMAGGFAALKDVPKVLVYRLARWINSREGRPPIPRRTLTRAPTAELRPGQRDADSLPPYPQLDAILKAYVERGRAPRSVGGTGRALSVANRVARMVERSEYKRRQAPPGVKIQPKAFGKDRRNPITHGFKPWAPV